MVDQSFSRTIRRLDWQAAGSQLPLPPYASRVTSQVSHSTMPTNQSMNQLINQIFLKFSQFLHNIYHETCIAASSSSRLSGCLSIHLPICLKAAHIADRVPTERIPVANEWFVSVCLFVCLSVSSYSTYLDRSSDRRWDENHRDGE